jgi:hypothetical protein
MKEDKELNSLKVAELRERLQTLGLPTKGKKQDLVKRLQEATSQEQQVRICRFRGVLQNIINKTDCVYRRSLSHPLSK